MKYVFRLTTAVLAQMDAVAPPKAHRRSPFIRAAVDSFLERKTKEPLVDRPHLRGRLNTYQAVCAILTQDQIAAITEAYPEVSVSVVIQAAVSSELKKPRYKKPPLSKTSATNVNEDPDVNPSTGSHPREFKAAFC